MKFIIWYQRNGKPYKVPDHDVDLKGWMDAMKKIDSDLANREKRVVKQNFFKNGTWISTVWMGIDSNLGFHSGEPIIFETVVFGGHHDNEGFKYSTEEQALDGHNRFLAKVRKISRRLRHIEIDVKDLIDEEKV